VILKRPKPSAGQKPGGRAEALAPLEPGLGGGRFEAHIVDSRDAQETFGNATESSFICVSQIKRLRHRAIANMIPPI